ncbi:MAG TPA: efflux transporter outer membrane subunit [Xanthomonadaceae bacterium]|nr:efflux transporter outer membrane subunit [Xanthomonadaceae bacterium]
MAPAFFRTRLLPAAVSFALLLAGCASTHGLAPGGGPLDADALAAARSLSGAHLSDAAFPRRDWWKALGDPQLDALVDEALAGTPTLALADARARQAIAQAGLADAERQPVVAASGQYSGIRIPESIAPPPLGGSYKGIFLLGLNFKYSPDLWGGQRAKWQAALGQARAAEVEAQDARLLIASNVAKAYVGLAQAYAALDVAQAEQDRSGGLLELGRQRVRAGLDNQLTLRQAESAVDAAMAQQQAAQQQIDAARNALAALLGEGPDRGLDIARPALLSAPAAGVPDVVPSELLGHRPDVVAARWQVEAAAHGIKAAKAAFYPTVNLSALVGVAAGTLGDLFDTKALVAQGGPAVSLPIFDGGRLRNTLASNDAQYDLAVAGYNQALVGALREVVDALQAARSLDDQLASTRQARDAAQAALALATQRYKAGLATRLDVLAAQQPLLRIDQQLAALRAQRLDAAIDLDRALGGGLAPTSPDTDIARAPTP